MPYGEYAKCPCCNKTTYDKEKTEQKFGYRNMGDGREAGKPCKVK